MELAYLPEGVCAKGMNIDLEENTDKRLSKIKSIKFYGGCPGNATGLAKALVGKTVEEVIKELKGITCGNKPTSCPDQLAKALEEYLNENN